jgi:hypothetical protein
MIHVNEGQIAKIVEAREAEESGARGRCADGSRDVLVHKSSGTNARLVQVAGAHNTGST